MILDGLLLTVGFLAKPALLPLGYQTKHLLSYFRLFGHDFLFVRQKYRMRVWFAICTWTEGYVDVSHLIGIYSPVYSTERGLADVRLFNLTNSNDLSAFNLCDFNISNATFQIQKQDITEQLIKGVFQMTLCDARDSTKKINIINGTLTDIHY